MSWQIVVVFHEKNLYLKKGRFRFWFSCCRGAWPVAEVYKLGSRRSRPTHHQVSSENGFFVQFFYKMIIYQDWLGTNIGKTPKKRGTFWQGPLPAAVAWEKEHCPG